MEVKMANMDDSKWYQRVLGNFIKSEIDHLLQRLWREGGEESFIVTASACDDQPCLMGSEKGLVYMEDFQGIIKGFLSFIQKDEPTKATPGPVKAFTPQSWQPSTTPNKVNQSRDQTPASFMSQASLSPAQGHSVPVSAILDMSPRVELSRIFDTRSPQSTTVKSQGSPIKASTAIRSRIPVSGNCKGGTGPARGRSMSPRVTCVRLEEKNCAPANKNSKTTVSNSEPPTLFPIFTHKVSNANTAETPITPIVTDSGISSPTVKKKLSRSRSIQNIDEIDSDEIDYDDESDNQNGDEPTGEKSISNLGNLASDDSNENMQVGHELDGNFEKDGLGVDNGQNSGNTEQRFTGTKFATDNSTRIGNASRSTAREKRIKGARKCKHCNKSFSLLQHLYRHILLHYSTHAYKCRHCSFSSKYYPTLKTHHERTHKKKVFTFPTLKEAVKQLEINGKLIEPSMNAHCSNKPKAKVTRAISRESNPGKSKLGTSKDPRPITVEPRSSDDETPTEVEKERAKMQNKHRRHYVMYDGKKYNVPLTKRELTCIDCNKELRTLYELKEHQYHINKVFECWKCGVTFKDRESIRTHLKQCLNLPRWLVKKIQINELKPVTTTRTATMTPLGKVETKQNKLKGGRKSVVELNDIEPVISEMMSPDTQRNVESNNVMSTSIKGSSKPSLGDASPDEQGPDCQSSSKNKSEKMALFTCPKCQRRFKFRMMLAKHICQPPKPADSSQEVNGLKKNKSNDTSMDQDIGQEKTDDHSNRTKSGSNIERLNDNEGNSDNDEDGGRNTSTSQAKPSTSPKYTYKQLLSMTILDKSCPICQKKFNRVREVKDHLVTHTREEPFRCRSCNKSFRWARGRLYHEKHAHNLTVFERKRLKPEQLKNLTRKSDGKVSGDGTHASGSKSEINVKMGENSINQASKHKKVHKKIMIMGPKGKKVIGTKGGIKSFKTLKKTAPTTVRLYTCSYPGCTKSYNSKGHLQDHVVMSHTKERTCKCEGCDMDFIHRSHFYAHKKRMDKQGKGERCRMVGIKTKSQQKPPEKALTKTPVKSLSIKTLRAVKQGNSENDSMTSQIDEQKQNESCRFTSVSDIESAVSKAKQCRDDEQSKSLRCYMCGCEFLAEMLLREHLLSDHLMDTPSNSPVSSPKLHSENELSDENAYSSKPLGTILNDPSPGAQLIVNSGNKQADPQNQVSDGLAEILNKQDGDYDERSMGDKGIHGDNTGENGTQQSLGSEFDLEADDGDNDAGSYDDDDDCDEDDGLSSRKRKLSADESGDVKRVREDNVNDN